MKKAVLVSFVVIAGLLSGSLHAQILPEESVRSFTSLITVQKDNSILVQETIRYDSGGIERHGIYRNIRSVSSEGRDMDITEISVSDGQGNPRPFVVSRSGKGVNIRIGDPDKTFSGERTYVVQYRAADAVGQLEDFDEIYWNITGNAWEIPIYESRAFVSLPGDVHAIQSACYYGPEGSTERCTEIESMEEIYGFEAPRLAPGEGFTVAVGFPKGVVEAYRVPGFWERYWHWILAGLLPLLTLFFSLRYWHRKGRDERKTRTIVAEYDAPEGMTPLEAAGIAKEKITSGDISAEIIYLATRGYVKIHYLEKRVLGFKSTDYELEKTKDFSDLPNRFDRTLLEILFGAKGSVKVSDLKKTFFKDVSRVVKSGTEALLEKGYYKNLGRMSGKALKFALLIPVLMGAFFGGIILFQEKILVVFVGVVISFVIFSAIYYFSPAKTEKGVRAKEQILGLKDYLRIAEKDRLEFHNAPEKKPEIFEKLLPFAMVLGVTKEWAREFEDIYTEPPSWYTGYPGAAFNAVIFTESLSGFSSSVATASHSSSGGSGGGGFAGGGGGGGGGGGW